MIKIKIEVECEKCGNVTEATMVKTDPQDEARVEKINKFLDENDKTSEYGGV